MNETKRDRESSPILQVGRLLHSLPISYNGSKQKIFGWIGEILLREAIDCDVAVDGFSGSGIISSLLSASGMEVYSSDTLGSAYAMTVTLAGNPGITMTSDQLERVTSHSCIDGVLFDDDLGVMSGYDTPYPGVFTKNEGIWLTRTREKMDELPIYERLIGLVALRSIACIQPFGTPNGRSTFSHRIKQKHKYGNGCLGHYLNSSYEIEVDKWFRKYVEKFNSAVSILSSRRLGHTICRRGDVIDLLRDVSKMDVDVAYFDPPYGGAGYRDYGVDYQVHEQIVGADPIAASDFFSATSHSKMFLEMLDLCEDIPKLIFSYNNKSWAPIEDIVAELRRRGYGVSVESRDHTHGKQMTGDYKNAVIEHAIIAKR